MSAHAALRETICRVGASLYNRGLTHGSTGNISVKLDEGGSCCTCCVRGNGGGQAVLRIQ